ncbi:hypothetical protein M409DRAFT_23257 [Zasmidium cellare ATCC 36951]|uniref:Uncharacterized protein n=1 Tax=Zasmidium cellare ATCC 36951 TaxID=1080233 RepID=A0A6A6CJ49_ZASCE|nr:uncharacterized protein M409DRAFT_23257 [Zasmidium cellare ATCC 36951]KAF2166623.1 hypothetical protein M409DRAFT_23257 [Zasmidium cellare ATCC 36951]
MPILKKLLSSARTHDSQLNTGLNGSKSHFGSNGGAYTNPVKSYNPMPRSEQDFYNHEASRFRPVALPQTDYGDAKPFLRGYSDELRIYGISERVFIDIVDTINIALVPNPEAQIFQKAADVAGNFLPGVAAIGLAVGQVGVGIGTELGHASTVAKALSKANLELFVPNGLEICIGDTKDLEAELGMSLSSHQTAYGIPSPEERLAACGSLVAPLSHVLLSLEHVGRSDVIAQLGSGIGNRDEQRKNGRAQRQMARGRPRRKGDALEKNIQCLIVRQATPESLAHWQKALQQSNMALEHETA